MYRHSPIRNPRSKGIKTKNVLQVCLLLAVCFWLIFQVKRSHDKKKEFDNINKDIDSTKISLSTTSKQSNDESVKFGRKDLQPKLEKEVELHEEHGEQDEEQTEEHLEHDEEKMDEEKDDGGGGGDDEIDENEQEKSDVEVDHEEMEVMDEETHTDDHEEEEEDEGSVHTHEGREEHYKADDASSAVVTDLASENGTNEEISSGETVNNGTSLIDFNENGPPSNTTITTISDSNQTEGPSKSISSDVSKSNEESNKQEVESDEGENLEGKEEILDPDEVENENETQHLEEKEVRMDLETLPEIETEGGNSEDTAVERR